MASVFTVVSTVQDYLNKHAEDCLNRMKDISERAKREEEESERVRLAPEILLLNCSTEF